MKKLLYPLLLSLLFCSTQLFGIAHSGYNYNDKSFPVNDTASQNLKRVYQKCRQLLLSDTAYATEQSFRLTDDIIYTTDAEGYLKSFNTEGFWKDLDYQSQERSAWPPSWHLYRLMLFARAWHKTGETTYLQAVHKGLDYWMKNDFICENWWHNQINIPYIFSSLMIMLDKESSTTELTYLDNVLAKRVPQANPTGQNKLWQHDIEARIALIHNDGAAFQKAIDGMKSLIEISTKEGIQPDYSYHQHGAMLQFGNYGFHYVNSLLFWMTTTANSDFAFEATKKKILYDYCSNGLRWTVFNKVMDLTTIGRQLRKDCDLKRGEFLNNNFNLILTDKTLNPCSFSLSGFEKKGDKPCVLSGNKSFWRSDYMVQRNNSEYMISVKTHGNNVKKIESINSENLKGAFLNDGVSLIQCFCSDYHNIEACWNWTMLPGTTCDTTRNPADPEVLKSSNQSDFVGQVSDGKSGISAMDYNRLGVKAHKSYFLLDHLMVALGSGIESPEIKNVVTTVDQKSFCYLSDIRLINKPDQWAWIDSVGYFFPGHQNVIYKSGQRTGDWSNIDKVSKMGTSKLFMYSLYLGHTKNNSYAYYVKTNCKKSEIRRMHKSKEIQILTNTTDVQSIKYNEGIMAVFYKPVSLKISATESIHPLQPCIMIYKKTGSRKEIWVSDPTRKLNSIQIQIGTQTMNVTLPTGDFKGSTVKAILTE